MVRRHRIVCVRLCGVLADVLVKIDPERFADKVVLEGGQKVICVALNRALYGALISILTLWRDLSGALGYWGFEPNLYGSCVMNKTMDGKQCSIF